MKKGSVKTYELEKCHSYIVKILFVCLFVLSVKVRTFWLGPDRVWEDLRVSVKDWIDPVNKEPD